MRTRAVLALALLLPLSALACGFCMEDRVAAVYDQAAVDKAVKEKRHIAFFAIESDSLEVTSKKITAALEGAGAVRATTRVSLPNQACSVVFDPRRTNLTRLVDAAQRAGIPIKALRVIDDGGKLRDPV